MKQSVRLKILLVLGLFFLNICAMVFLIAHVPSSILKVAFLDVGQGDSIYIEAPNGATMLVDGGRDDRVLGKLAKVMPYGKKRIDAVIATHPDADHVGGLIPVMDNFQVGAMVYSGKSSNTKTYHDIETRMTKIPHVLARTGMQIVLDQAHGVYFDILYPDHDVSGVKETNDASIVGQLVYGNERFMLTGDAPLDIEYHLMETVPKSKLQSTVLKLGHHGSRTSSSEAWLETIHPEYAIVSAGKNNRYGHPHKEVIDRLHTLMIPVLSTITLGTIVMTTDGQTLSVPN